MAEGDAELNDADPSDVPGGLDLSPRAVVPVRRRWVPRVVLVLVMVALGVLVLKVLGDATLQFQNADEAVARRSELGDRRFLVQGTVVPGTIDRAERVGEPVVAFSIAFNGVALDVLHVGNPPELFKAGEAVVLEGSWVHAGLPDGVRRGRADDGWHFASDRMLAKHDATYEADNSDRLRDAERGGDLPTDQR